MPVIDDRTPLLDLPLPNKDNTLEDDAQRLRDGLGAIDTLLFGKQAALGFTPENSAAKGVPDGYAALDGTGKVPAIQLPGFVDDVVEVANFASLPTTGETGKIYVTLDNNKTWRWGGSAYAEISASPGSTDAVPEGASNLYHTPARVAAAIPIASAGVLGGVKIGAGLSIDGSGVLGATSGGGSVMTLQEIAPAGDGLSSVPVPDGYVVGAIMVGLNGSWLAPSDYTAVDGVTIGFVGFTVGTIDSVLVAKLSTVTIGNLTAAAIANAPTGTIAATTVQAAINEIVSDLAASSGSSLVGFLQDGTGAVARTAQAKAREAVSVPDFGSTSLTALNSAGVLLTAGGTLRLPAGTYTLSGTFTFAGQRLNMEGDGANTSFISYSPASAGVAIEYNNPAAGGLYQGSIKGLGFSSGNSIDKTAIQLYNAADCEVHGIGIPGGAWLGTGSIGIRTYGRQTLSIRNCQIICARPVVFSKNPVFTSLNTDHYLVEHCELSTSLSTGACIEFENGVMHTNTTLQNLALTGGKWGILWNDTTSVGASYALSIENIRTEQGVDATGWSIDLQSTGQSLQNVSIKNAYLDPGRGGIRLRRAQNITLENVYFTQTSGTQLDITLVAGSRLVMTNCFFQTGGTKTITNGRCIRRSMSSSQGHTVEEWVFDDSMLAGAEYSSTYLHGEPVSLANGATLLLGAAGTSTGFVFISSSEDVNAIFTLMGATAQTREISDPDGFFSTVKSTASSYNVYSEAGNYFLQNNRGSTATVSVFKMLTVA